MKRADVNDLSSPGFLPDPPPIASPAGAWTDSRNVRYRDGAVEKVTGYVAALGSLSATAVFIESVNDGLNAFWVYGTGGGGHGGFGGGDVLYATDGLQHSDISHPSITYSADLDVGWSGGGFHGFTVVTDGSNIPQQWTPSLANNASSLSYWPATTLIAKRLAFYKDFIWALRITDTGTYNPRLIRWSDRAQSGALPTSWDYTDPTNQAGIVELAQTPDAIVDALALRDSMMVYKESYTWLADYIGGLDVFSFRQVFSEIGAMAENCAVAFGAKHLVLSDHDLVLHDGSNASSIVDSRTRRWLFNRISSERYKRSFLTADMKNREILVCFAETGYDYPNLALVWNWHEDKFDVRELGGQKTYAARGIVPNGTAISFDTDTDLGGAFDDAVGAFDVQNYSQFQERLLIADAGARKVYQMDTGETFDGSAMSCYAERTAMGITQDLGTIKRLWRIWPKVIATEGEVLNFYISARESLTSPISYDGPYPFVVGEDSWIDLRIDGRVFDIRLEYNGSQTFRLSGAGFEFDNTGER